MRAMSSHLLRPYLVLWTPARRARCKLREAGAGGFVINHREHGDRLWEGNAASNGGPPEISPQPDVLSLLVVGARAGLRHSVGRFPHSSPRRGCGHDHRGERGADRDEAGPRFAGCRGVGQRGLLDRGPGRSDRWLGRDGQEQIAAPFHADVEIIARFASATTIASTTRGRSQSPWPASS